MSERKRILVITPVSHISGVLDVLRSAGEVTLMENPSRADVLARIADHDAVFTNPNKSDVFLDAEIMDRGSRLKAICTASTGTNHIDKRHAAARSIAVLSLTEEREVINRITSTAEHAFALMMASLRNISAASASVGRGEWDYEPYIGRQLSALTVGVVGYGRLGSLFAGYCKAFGSRVLVYDPYKRVSDPGLIQTDAGHLLEESDIISLHVHVTEETTGMVDRAWLGRMKRDVLLVNTARGDVCDEAHLIEFLRENPRARYATDVLADEVRSKGSSRLKEFAASGRQVLITPHIGGMTREGQAIAYNHAARMLRDFLGRT